MIALKYVAAIVIGYILGCSNMAYYISKIKKVDIQQAGSKNLGASNAMILMGWKAGIFVGIHDIMKAVLAVMLAKVIFPEAVFAGAAAGVSCVLGHIFPFWLKFKGGKGFAAYVGMTVALNWKLALVAAIAILVLTLITDYIVSGTTATILLVPIWCGVQYRSVWLVLILLIATSVIIWKHRENYVRIWNGTEIGLRKANKGEYRTNQ